MGGNTIFLFLIQLGVILLLAKLLSGLLRFYGQPSLVGEILAGIILGPTILGRMHYPIYNFLFPAHESQMLMIDTIAWLGVFFFILSCFFS